MIKEMLENYNIYTSEIGVKEHKIKKLELEEISMSGSNFSVNGDIRPQGYMSSNIERKVIDNTDKINKLKAEIEEIKYKIDMIDGLIKTLIPFNQRIIEMRYKAKLSLESIAGDIGRDVPSVSRTINNCILKMEKVYQS